MGATSSAIEVVAGAGSGTVSLWSWSSLALLFLLCVFMPVSIRESLGLCVKLVTFFRTACF